MKRKKKEYLECAAFTVPSLFLVMLVFYIPFVMSLYYSLTEWNGISKAPKFIGLENFKKLFSGSSDFMQSLIFTGKYTIIFMILVNILALAIAVALVQKIPAANVMRSMFFIPYIMSMTIVGFIWKFIFSLGFYIVLYIAGLQAVPTDVLEAAEVDGATSWKKFFKVTLPLLGPSITTCVFMSLTNAVKVFDIILALTKGGPGGSTYSVTLDIYREAFQNNNYGLGSAKALVFFVIILVITQLVLKAMHSREVDL